MGTFGFCFVISRLSYVKVALSSTAKMYICVAGNLKIMTNFINEFINDCYISPY